MLRPIAFALALGAALQTPAPSAPPAISVTQSARALQPGELVVLAVRTADPTKALHVRAFDKTFGAFPTGSDGRAWEVLVGIDLDVAPGAYVVSISTDAATPVRTTRTLKVLAKAFPTRRLTVDEAFVNPPPEALERIQRDAKDLEKV